MSALANWACRMRCILSGFFCAIFIIIFCFFSGKDLNNISCSSFKNTKLSNHELSDLGGDIDGDLGDTLSQLFLRQVGLYQSSWLELDLVFACEMGGDIDGVLAGEIGLEEDDDQLGLRPSNEIGL